MAEINPEHILYLKNASITIDDNLILSGVNLTIKKGEFCYLIGKVGSGKTSLIKTINAELPLKEGEGIVAGISLNTLKKRQVPFLRRKLGIVFQDFQLLMDRTIFENLQFVLRATGWTSKKDINDRISEVLDRVGLGYKGFKMPHQLSGGEQQRVVIARALLNNPELILADEPTGNLDPDTSADIMKLLREISSNGKAVLMATHNYTLLKKFSGRTIKCDDGKLSELDENLEIDFSALMNE